MAGSGGAWGRVVVKTAPTESKTFARPERIQIETRPRHLIKNLQSTKSKTETLKKRS